MASATQDVGTQAFCVGQWLVRPDLNQISRDGKEIHLEPKVMRVLVCLAAHAGQTVEKEFLVKQVWECEFVTDQVLATAIWEIRQALGDLPRPHQFVETVSKRGYRLIAPVRPADVGTSKAQLTRRRPLAQKVAAVVLAIGIIAAAEVEIRRLLVSPPAPIRSIAVLPLTNLSGDTNQEYFADGITEDLITTLGKISTLRVISRQSVMRYKGSQKSLPEIADELDVDAVVEGTVSRSGDRVRITAQLIQTRPETQLWAEQYDRDLRDVLALQNEIARGVAGGIRATLSVRDQARLVGTRKVEPAAELAYLKGRYFIHRWPASDFQKCAEYLSEATQRDPSYAEAYAALAICYAQMAWWQPPKEIYPRVKEAANKAIQLDNSVAEGHAALGVALLFFDWNWTEADKEFKLALELNPSNALTHVWYSSHLLFIGHFDSAVVEGRRAVELDPASLLTNRALTYVYWMSRRYDDAIPQAKLTLQMDPSNMWSKLDLTMAYSLKGSTAEADAAAARFGFTKEPLFVAPSQRQNALKLFDREVAQQSATYVDPFAIAMQYARLGDNERALEWLERAYDDRSSMMVQIKVNPYLDGLHSEPRFRDLVRRMNFPP